MSVHINKRERVIKGGRNRSVRPKSFKTEESAKKWAESQKISKYTVKQLKSGLSKKFNVVSE
ncbi:hypothetical protein ACFLZ7_03680 [Nanoarchaeota archaeon]